MNKSHPYYIADNSSEYMQNSQQKYFRGKTSIIKVQPGLNVVGTLVNPIDSGVKIYLNKVLTANLSDIPLVENVYYKATIKQELNESYNVALANEYNNEDIKSNGKIFYGEDISITDGISAETFSIGPYQNFRDNPSGSVILYPGMNYIIEMYIVNPKQSGGCIISFAWWEEII